MVLVTISWATQPIELQEQKLNANGICQKDEQTRLQKSSQVKTSKSYIAYQRNPVHTERHRAKPNQLCPNIRRWTTMSLIKSSKFDGLYFNGKFSNIILMKIH